jgi:hypothetical protein
VWQIPFHSIDINRTAIFYDGKAGLQFRTAQLSRSAGDHFVIVSRRVLWEIHEGRISLHLDGQMKEKKSVSVITANFGPFRLVLRPTDVWEPTLEQINARSYDYVKLHRLSDYFDVGIAPFSLGICFDGTLILPATEEFRDRARALAQFNKTLSELLLGGIYCEAASPDDIGVGSLSFTGYSRILGAATGPTASFHKAARSKHIGTLDVIRLLEPETVSIKTLHEALAKGRGLLGLLGGDIPTEQMLYAATFYVRKQWAESLIHIWTVTERIIEIAWQKHVISSPNQPSSKRRSFLEDHRTWSASARLEVFFQKTLLPSSSYEKLDGTRKARNDLAHRGIIPSYEVAYLAMQACFELASLCASDFMQTDLFVAAVALINDRCNPKLFPDKTVFEAREVSHWLELPPLPGDAAWGDKEYEIIEEISLKPLKS